MRWCATDALGSVDTLVAPYLALGGHLRPVECCYLIGQEEWLSDHSCVLIGQEEWLLGHLLVPIVGQRKARAFHVSLLASLVE